MTTDVMTSDGVDEASSETAASRRSEQLDVDEPVAVHVVKGIRCDSEILRFCWRTSCREKMNFSGRGRKSH